MGTPSLITKINIIKHKLLKYKINLNESCIEHLSLNATNIAEIEGILKTITAKISVNPQDIDIFFLNNILSNNENSKPRYFFFQISDQIQTAIKQYLTFFNDYAKTTKGINFNIEVLSVQNGISIELPRMENEDEFKICIKEYMSFVKSKIDEITPNVTTTIDQNKLDILTIELRSQVRFLQTSLEIKSVENKFLTETLNSFKELLINKNSQPINVTINNSNDNKLEGKQSVTYDVFDKSPELLEQISAIRNELSNDKVHDLHFKKEVYDLFEDLEKDINKGKVKKSMIDNILTKTSQMSSIGSFIINLVKILNQMS